MTSPRVSPAIAPTEEIVAELRNGRMVILVDEEDRENEGDLLIAAEHITPEAINFMVTHARGLVCLTITAARARQLGPASARACRASPVCRSRSSKPARNRLAAACRASSGSISQLQTRGVAWASSAVA